jgi:hypothetical protein
VAGAPAVTDRRSRRLGVLLVLAALAMAAWGMAPEIVPAGPWQRGWLGHNGARYAHIARNHARFGFLALGGAPLLECAPAAGQDVPWEGREPLVYGHHPPGVALALGLLFAISGPDETLARLSAAGATLAALLLLAALVAGVAGAVAGGAAALGAACLPMTGAYGAHVEVQGSYVLAAFLLALLAYRRWRRGGSALPFVAACVLASSLDWFGLYAPAVCALDALLRRPRRRGAAVFAASLALLLFGAWFLWLASLPAMSAALVLGAAGVRGLSALGADDAPVSEYAARWWTDISALLPLVPLTLLAAVAGALRELRARPAEADEGAALLRQLLIPPVLHALLFPAGLLVHAYWLFALPPALATGLVLARGRFAALLRAGVLPATCVLGLLGTRAALPPPDPFPALLGQALAAHTAPGDVILTNYPTNVLSAGAAADAHTTRLPEVSYYADRPVRGGVGVPGESGVTVALDEALLRRPDAAWFVSVTPFGEEPSPALAARLLVERDGEALRLSGAPLVELHRLRR